MSKILLINGSPNQRGCTFTALREISLELAKEGVESEILWLGKEPIADCIACGKCVRTCPAKALSMKDNRIAVDQRLCLSYGDECGQACIAACPRHILRPVNGISAAVRTAGAAAPATPPAA